MPPSAKITKDMIVEAGVEIIRESGIGRLSVRSVAGKLGCSTQPIMYHFKKIDELTADVYRRADEFHTRYIMDFFSGEPMLDIGILYIRFAAREKNLFRFLFQSDLLGGNITELVGDPRLEPMFEVMARSADIDIEAARGVFHMLFLVAHGYASLFANNSTEYDEAAVQDDLRRIYKIAVMTAREEREQK